MATQLRIENVYEGGQVVLTSASVETPAGHIDIDQWFDEHVFPHTGVGTQYSHVKASYSVTVVASDRPDLVGRQYAWG